MAFCVLYVEMWCSLLPDTPRWGAADAEIKVPSGENTAVSYTHLTLPTS